MSSITDYTDRNTCPLFGDMVLVQCCSKVVLTVQVLQDAILRIDGVGKEFLYVRWWFITSSNA